MSSKNLDSQINSRALTQFFSSFPLCFLFELGLKLLFLIA